jgi:plasmid stabilization system protein ParE
MSGYALTPRARADLKGIWTYTADRWDIDQASRKLDLSKIETVALPPASAAE